MTKKFWRTYQTFNEYQKLYKYHRYHTDLEYQNKIKKYNLERYYKKKMDGKMGKNEKND